MALASIVGASWIWLAPAAFASSGLSLSLPAATAGQPTQASYASPAGEGNVTVLQLQVGTSKVWKMFARLNRSHGTATIPAKPIGVYPIRLAEYSRHGRLVASRVDKLQVYGSVPLTTLLSQDPIGAENSFDDDQDYGGIIQTQSNTFTYAYYFNGADGPAGLNAISIGTDNPCRSVTIQWVPFDGPGNPPEPERPATASIVQQAANPVTDNIEGDTIGTMTANLTLGQSWGLSLGNTSDYNEFDWYFNGSAVCDTKTLTPEGDD